MIQFLELSSFAIVSAAMYVDKVILRMNVHGAQHWCGQPRYNKTKTHHVSVSLLTIIRLRFIRDVVAFPDRRVVASEIVRSTDVKVRAMRSILNRPHVSLYKDLAAVSK